MIEPKEAKKIAFEDLDEESQQFYYELFKKYVIRKQISDNNKKLTSLFIKKMKTSNPREYAKGFNQFNNYFANSSLISNLSYDEFNTNFLQDMTEDQFNYYLNNTGNDFVRKLALICYSSRPSERIPNRLNFETMQAYANMQYYILSQAKIDKNESLEILFTKASKRVRKEFEEIHGYSYMQLPIAEKRTNYKSIAKKMAPIWKKMISFYIDKLKVLDQESSLDFISQNFIFTETDKSIYLKALNEINERANQIINEQRQIAHYNAMTMPGYFILSEYEEVFSKSYEDEIYSEITNQAITSILYKYLEDPIFETQNQKIKS